MECMPFTTSSKSAVAIVSTIFAVSIPIAHAVFSDVYNHSANAGAIHYLAEQGIVRGYPDGTFRPGQKINRAEFLKIVLEADKTVFTAPCSEGEFPDVSPSDWFVIYTLHAKCFGIIAGYPDGTFRPSKAINFVEAAKIIVNVLDLPASPTGIWYEGYVRALASKKAIPVSISSFDQQITRGEMAEIMYRILVPAEHDSRTYEELTGVIDASTRSPVELIEALNRTDWTDQILLDTLCQASERPDIVAITGGAHPPCEFMQAYKWHEWRDRFWPSH
jgi:S-layer homology domain